MVFLKIPRPQLNLCLHFPHFSSDQDHAHQEGDEVCHRPGIQNAVQAKEQGQDQHQRDQEEDLSRHGEDQSLEGLADGGEEIGGQKLHAVDDDHEEEGAHKADGKFIIHGVPRAEQRNDLVGEELEQKETDGGDHQVAGDGQPVGAPHPVELFCPVIKADDGLGALGDADDHRQKDGVGLHDDAAGCQRDICAIFREGAVVGEGVVQNDLYQRDPHLVQAVAHPQGSSPEGSLKVQAHIGKPYFHRFEPADVGDGCQEGEELADNGGPGGSCHAQIKKENEDGIQDGVGNGADQHTGHGITGASVRPDQVAHAGGDHLEGHAKGDDPGIGLRIGEIGRCGAERQQKGMEEYLGQYRVEDAKCEHHGDPVSHHGFCFFLFASPQVKGELRGAPDADEKGDGKADGCEGIRDIGCRISQISHALADEDLVYDIVERTHQHGDDAGDGK